MKNILLIISLFAICVGVKGQTMKGDPSSVLDYAILCYAGDDRFTADAEKSSELGRKQARIVLEETENHAEETRTGTQSQARQIDRDT